VARTPKIGPLRPPVEPAGDSQYTTARWFGGSPLRPRVSSPLTESRLATAAVTDRPMPFSQSAPKNRIIAGLPSRELNHLKPHLQRISWHNGEIPIDFPESGMVCTFAVMDDGRTVALAAIGREGFLGVPAFFGAEIAQLRAVVVIDGDALRLGRDELHRLFPVSPQFTAAMHRYGGRYLGQIAAIGACHALHKVQQRLASWMLIARDRTGSDLLPLTHESLSELLGCRRASVTESLALLEDAKIIRCGRGQVSILDHRRLCRWACECYRQLTTM
jgi:CRP-like cAMP-binding protein